MSIFFTAQNFSPLRFPQFELPQEFPFTIEPKQLELEVGETKELSVSCFPVAWTPQLDVYMGLTGFYWLGGFKWCAFPMFLFPFFGGSWAKNPTCFDLDDLAASVFSILAFFSHQNRPNPTLQISCPPFFRSRKVAIATPLWPTLRTTRSQWNFHSRPSERCPRWT